MNQFWFSRTVFPPPFGSAMESVGAAWVCGTDPWLGVTRKCGSAAVAGGIGVGFRQPLRSAWVVIAWLLPRGT